MKKMMFAAVAALAMVGAANAEKSYGIQSEDYVKAYSLDTNPGSDHKSWYSCYAMKQEDAQAAMGTKETVTYATMAAWLGENFAANMQSVIDNAELMPCQSYYSSVSRYYFSGSGDELGSDLETAIGVFFYDDGANVAYNVLANEPGTTSRFSFDDYFCDSSGWTAASVPEPTSGLLLLLGVAGLCLRRKQK